MLHSKFGRILRSASLLLSAGLIGLAAQGQGLKAKLTNHVPHAQIAKSTHLGRAPKNLMMKLAIPLRVNDEVALKTLVDRLNSPADPLYGQFLSREQFVQQFAPTQSEYDQVVAAFVGQGFAITATHDNRLLIEIRGSVATVESAFQTEIHQYKTASGRTVNAPIIEPGIDPVIGARIHGIVGLSNFNQRHTHIVRDDDYEITTLAKKTTATNYGLTPAQIRSAYNLNGLPQTGQGQTLALIEFDGFTPSDITSFTAQYGLGTPNLQTVLIDGFDGNPTVGPESGAVEVTLDIEMALAVAPQLKILVYEAAQAEADTDMLALLNKIASDNLAQTISNSWGSPEDQTPPTTMQSENTIFMEFAAQGQSSFVASGDNGAYDDEKTISTDDPSSQPYSVAVGGTSLKINSDGTYISETTWNGGTIKKGGGGGGISSVWPLPSYQTGLGTTANMGSTTMRMMPDVSLYADPKPGYAIYFQGKLQKGGGGTSYASPLWAAFTALVNEQRQSSGMAPVGFPLPAIYKLGASSLYGSTFHDISDSSTNLYYPAVTGYDLATGWGSFAGAGLFSALTNSSAAQFTAANLLVDGTAR